MKRRIRIHPQAYTDIEETFLFIEERNPRAALEWLQRLDQFFVLLAQQPWLGVSKDRIRRQMRRVIMDEFRILYRVSIQEITIVRVLHPRRRADPRENS